MKAMGTRINPGVLIAGLIRGKKIPGRTVKIEKEHIPVWWDSKALLKEIKRIKREIDHAPHHERVKVASDNVGG